MTDRDEGTEGERVTLTENGPVVDARIIGAGFALDPAAVPGLLRDGAITSRLERGEGEDAGRQRLTFWHGGRALRLIVSDGNPPRG